MTKTLLLSLMALSLLGCKDPDQSRLEAALGTASAPTAVIKAPVAPTPAAAPIAPPAVSQEAFDLPVDYTSTKIAMFDAKAMLAKQDTSAALTDFVYPVDPTRLDAGGYPIYLIECNRESRQCVGATGEPIGTMGEVAKTLPPILNKDALSDRYICDPICVNRQGDVVGVISEALLTYIAAHPDVVTYYQRHPALTLPTKE